MSNFDLRAISMSEGKFIVQITYINPERKDIVIEAMNKVKETLNHKFYTQILETKQLNRNSTEFILNIFPF